MKEATKKELESDLTREDAHNIVEDDCHTMVDLCIMVVKKHKEQGKEQGGEDGLGDGVVGRCVELVVLVVLLLLLLTHIAGIMIAIIKG